MIDLTNFSTAQWWKWHRHCYYDAHCHRKFPYSRRTCSYIQKHFQKIDSVLCIFSCTFPWKNNENGTKNALQRPLPAEYFHIERGLSFHSQTQTQKVVQFYAIHFTPFTDSVEADTIIDTLTFCLNMFLGIYKTCKSVKKKKNLDCNTYSYWRQEKAKKKDVAYQKCFFFYYFLIQNSIFDGWV